MLRSSWKSLSRTMMTIPKFKKVWDKTKDIHSTEYRDVITSLWLSQWGVQIDRLMELNDVSPLITLRY
jgi:hypothetical protein